ncbi:uncharacterized protein LOC134183141 isoform X2 [Corticium candelabrum]|uniref:uncharacterized protein LOC134183141 isoform X2 n=1 Tax=Corticium candelabrum TaxID=121492 RepID=UPI002E26A301|nr:uncharacterized protein LOC134183141 isoform X2 [Corticium candelabrum]
MVVMLSSNSAYTEISTRTAFICDNMKLKKEEHSRYVRKRKHPSVVDDRAKQKRSVPDVWFDDVDADILDVAEQGKPYLRILPQETGSINETICMVPKPLVTGNCKDVTRVIAMDCEMVGAGDRGCISLLARVSIVNSHGHVLYDTFVKPKERVTDYRTFVSGVRASDLKQAPPFSEVQNQVAKLIDGKILVGHALNNDLQALLLNHPHRMIRDTQHYPPFKKIANGKRPSLRLLSKQVLHIDVQKGEHSSVEDARAAMALYQTHKKEWESGCIMVNPHKKTAQDS